MEIEDFKSINIKPGYKYLSDYNLILNEKTEDIFYKYAHNINKVNIININPSEDLIRKQVKYIKQMTLEISQDCNLRCKYCLFGGHYYFRRSRSHVLMPYETAKAAVDYLHGIIQDRYQRDFCIGFYGGEPLLNFSTIKSIVTYAKDKFEGWKLRFAITTNGTLLTDDIINYLIMNNFSMVISLDGPSDIHDAKRRFADGRGSFDIVMKNLKRIHEKDEAYFKTIAISIVWSRELPLEKIYRFFADEEGIVRDNILILTNPVGLDTDYHDVYKFDRQSNLQEVKRVLSSILDKIQDHKQLTPMDRLLFFDQLWSLLKSKTYSSLYGACFFNEKIFVDAEGCFHICHMMNNRFSFGDVRTGFNFSRMEEIAKDYLDTVKVHCYDCPVKFLCVRCYPRFAKNGFFECHTDTCQVIRKALVRSLKRYIKLNEMGISPGLAKYENQTFPSVCPS